ncbi:hypothetical protein L7F22_054219 [Adiantum nelumboides]|nr:hypothetical protein [Adiantum nelumboides]
MPKIEAIREMYRGKKVIVGRDKLDVVRGVIQKLQAFHKLLEEFPEWRDNVVLIQVTAPSLNDSPILERQVSELVSHINGEFGSLSFTPVHHYHQIIERDEYFALLSVADLAIVSSLRDGMTASTMEYVVAQHMLGSKAPLLLSEFTGSAGRLRSAIQINPWATFSCAKAINYALKMPHEERESRHDDLYHQVVSHTSHTWAASLVKLLVQRILGEQSAHFTPPLNRSLLVQRYREAGKRMFLLDYDGTLTPIVKDPEAALPSKKLLEALQKLTSDEQHGGYMREPGSKTWINLTKELDMSWMNDIKGVFEYFTERTSGANIEMKKSSITWHYRNADPDYGVFQAKECQAHLDNLVAQQGLAIEVLVGKKNLECRPLAVNKGEIVKRILYHHADTELVFCAGDDRTDEDMFRTLCNLSPNFPGSDSPSTLANDSLDSPARSSPRSWLRRITRRPSWRQEEGTSWVCRESICDYQKPKIVHLKEEDGADPTAQAKPRLIKQLPHGTEDADVYELFRPYGALAQAQRILTNPTGHVTGFRGMALVVYYSEEDAAKAQAEMHCAEIEGKTISVSIDNVARRPNGGNHQEFSPAAQPFVPSFGAGAGNGNGRGMNATAPAFQPPLGSPSSLSSAQQQQPGPIVAVPGTNLQYSASAATYIDPCNLFCKNLDPALDSNDLFTMFKTFGRIVSARVMRDDQGVSREFGFVSYTNPDDAAKALNAMNNTMQGSKLMTVRLHEPKRVRQDKLSHKFGTQYRNPSASPHLSDEGSPTPSPGTKSPAMEKREKRGSNSYFKAAIEGNSSTVDADQLRA